MSLFCMSMTKSLSDEYDELVDAAPSLSLPDSSANTHQHVTTSRLRTHVFCIANVSANSLTPKLT